MLLWNIGQLVHDCYCNYGDTTKHLDIQNTLKTLLWTCTKKPLQTIEMSSYVYFYWPSVTSCFCFHPCILIVDVPELERTTMCGHSAHVFIFWKVIVWYRKQITFDSTVQVFECEQSLIFCPVEHRWRIVNASNC